MADLSWGDVVIVGLVAFAGFTFVSFWFSGVMSRRGWNWQAKSKPKGRRGSQDGAGTDRTGE